MSRVGVVCFQKKGIWTINTKTVLLGHDASVFTPEDGSNGFLLFHLQPFLRETRFLKILLPSNENLAFPVLLTLMGEMLQFILFWR